MLVDALSDLFQAPLEIVDASPLSGGCISDVFAVRVCCADANSWSALKDLHGGKSQAQWVIKRNSADLVSNFRCEREGLCSIAESGTIRVPKVYAVDVVGDHAYLVMERIEISRSGSSQQRFSSFGRKLALFHQATRGQAIGWPTDNFLGAAHQPNEPCKSWPEFVATRRIGFQIKWASDQGLVDQRLAMDCEKIISEMLQLLSGREESSSLLHGDLWSGNYLFDSDQQPVLIDPAVYRGCREAEWGMIKWFGNCGPDFEQAYQDVWPMADGWQRRVGVYVLYHQLNHLNLFGSSYADTCRRTASVILKAS
jgi:fructosamine-3-kinase